MARPKRKPQRKQWYVGYWYPEFTFVGLIPHWGLVHHMEDAADYYAAKRRISQLVKERPAGDTKNYSAKYRWEDIEDTKK